jgi:hypothetical protein
VLPYHARRLYYDLLTDQLLHPSGRAVDALHSVLEVPPVSTLAREQLRSSLHVPGTLIPELQ